MKTVKNTIAYNSSLDDKIRESLYRYLLETGFRLNKLYSIESMHHFIAKFFKKHLDIHDFHLFTLNRDSDNLQEFIINIGERLDDEIHSLPPLIISKTDKKILKQIKAGKIFHSQAYMLNSALKTDNYQLPAGLFIPLMHNKKPIGLIILKNIKSLDEKSEFLILNFAQLAAPAINNILLANHWNKTARELKRQMFNLSILFNVGKAMNFINDLTRLLKLILDKSIEACNADKGSLMLWDDNTEELVIRVVRGLNPEIEEKIASGEIKPKRIKYGEGIAGRVYATSNHILVNDTAADERFSHSTGTNVSSILCVPLKTQKECIGVINISNKESNKIFNPDDVDLLMNLAGQAAVMIENARLYELAITDGMTGLFIHRYFQQQLETETRRARRYGSSLSLIITDIDHFKNFNDKYGHQLGDTVLKEVARVMKNSCREIDIIARYGGEEFAVICPETDIKGALILAERLRIAVEKLVVKAEDLNLKVTISLGVATSPIHSVDKDELIKLADQSLYKAKEQGRNKTVAAGNEPVPDLRTTKPKSASEKKIIEIISQIACPELDGKK